MHPLRGKSRDGTASDEDHLQQQSRSELSERETQSKSGGARSGAESHTQTRMYPVKRDREHKQEVGKKTTHARAARKSVTVSEKERRQERARSTRAHGREKP